MSRCRCISAFWISRPERTCDPAVECDRGRRRAAGVLGAAVSRVVKSYLRLIAGGEDGFARFSSGRWMPVRGGALSAKGLLPTTIAADESSGGLGKAVGVP
jgi:hypothetical protein